MHCTEKLKSKRKEMEKTIKENRDQIENLFEGDLFFSKIRVRR